MNIFIVDDSDLVAERLADLLKEVPGVALVGRAADAAAAARAVAQLHPDVLLLDLQMPGGSGFEVLQSVRQNMPALVVIVFTNYPYPQYRKRCLAAGANFFLDKSTEFEKIPAILRKLAERGVRIAPTSR